MAGLSLPGPTQGVPPSHPGACYLMGIRLQNLVPHLVQAVDPQGDGTGSQRSQTAAARLIRSRKGVEPPALGTATTENQRLSWLLEPVRAAY